MEALPRVSDYLVGVARDAEELGVGICAEFAGPLTSWLSHKMAEVRRS